MCCCAIVLWYWCIAVLLCCSLMVLHVWFIFVIIFFCIVICVDRIFVCSSARVVVHNCVCVFNMSIITYSNVRMIGNLCKRVLVLACLC